MFLPINSERVEIFSQIRLIQKIRIRLANYAQYLKEFNHVKVLFKFIENHLAQLEAVQFGKPEEQDQKRTRIELYLQANTRIKNHFAKKQQQVKQLLYECRTEVYGNAILQGLSKIINSLSSIEWKIIEMGRFRREEELQKTEEIVINE